MKRITAWAAVLTLTLSLLTGCAQIDESSADELPFVELGQPEASCSSFRQPSQRVIIGG